MGITPSKTKQILDKYKLCGDDKVSIKVSNIKDRINCIRDLCGKKFLKKISGRAKSIDLEFKFTQICVSGNSILFKTDDGISKLKCVNGNLCLTTQWDAKCQYLDAIFLDQLKEETGRPKALDNTIEAPAVLQPPKNLYDISPIYYDEGPPSSPIFTLQKKPTQYTDEYDVIRGGKKSSVRKKKKSVRKKKKSVRKKKKSVRKTK